MSRPESRWVGAALLVGAIYLAAGVGFGALAARAPSHALVVAWRLAAWVASALAFAAHIGYEQLRLRRSPSTTALHVAFATAVGACALAVAAMIHVVSSGTGNPGRIAIALVAWPAITAVPAFLVALAVAAVMSRLRPRPSAGD